MSLIEFMPLLLLHSERCKVEAWMREISRPMFPKSDAYNFTSVRCPDNLGFHDKIKLGNGAQLGPILKIYSEHLHSKSPEKSCQK